jgi:phosphoribosylaminoimidazole-succinocarboxamide synthase
MTTLSLNAPARQEGKTKVITPHPSEAHQCIVTFKDSATAFNGVKKEEFEGKGRLNASISALLFSVLEQAGIPTCYVGKGEEASQLIYKHLTMIPLEIVVRNDAYGSLCKRFPWFEQGQALKQPIVEFPLKDDALGDPVLPEGVIEEQGMVPAPYTLATLKRLALTVNDVFLVLFDNLNIRCADFKLEVGITHDGQLVLADELSPDNFRLRDKTTGQILDKDVFRLGTGSLLEAYQAVENRLTATTLTLASEQTQRYIAELTITYRPGILHPESRAVLEGIHQLGFNNVEQANVGKYMRIVLQGNSHRQAEQQLHHLAEELLINPVIEEVTIASLTQQIPTTEAV